MSTIQAGITGNGKLNLPWPNHHYPSVLIILLLLFRKVHCSSQMCGVESKYFPVTRIYTNENGESLFGTFHVQMKSSGI